MTTTMEPIAVVGISAIMPEAPDAATFWNNIKSGRYSISDVPPERWDPQLYYDPDRHAPDKTYSRIGGWVRDFPWEPLAWKLPIPPAVSTQMDDGQKWAVACTRAALLDAGWPDWTVDPERVAVIIGNAIGGDKQHRSNLRIQFPAFARDLCAAPSFAALPQDVRDAVLAETRASFLDRFEEITEDTMPGELANVLAGRVANLFNFRGPNFTADAACASGLAAMSAAVRGLQAGDFDAVITGGIDRNMNATGFVKFCKIGALSATGTRPFDADADGFVMGEGAALFVLKRLSDAERDGDRIYAVLLGVAGSSDGRGKGITAPNPVGQRLAVERAWHVAGADPALATCIEAHGTSTRVGDATELASLTDVFRKAGAANGSIALGSVKSNIGHLKGAAGAAGLFKAVLSLHEKVLAPSLHFEHPNESVDWEDIPFRVNTELREWPAHESGARYAGVSAFGFGGTNFHAVLEEYVPGRHAAPAASRSFAGATIEHQSTPTRVSTPAARKAPLRGAAVVGGADDAEVTARLEGLGAEASAGRVPAPAAPDPALAGAAVRVAIDYADAGDLAAKAGKAVQALRGGNPAIWKILRAQGVFVGRGAPGKVAFLYTGQGSQYVNMLRDLRRQEPLVAATFDEADRVMAPLLGKPLTEYIFADNADEATAQRLQQQLMQTEITQPAVLTTDLALTRMLDAYGVRPDMVMGHSLGEYGALVAAGALSFDAALEAVSARGREMANLAVGDNGAMAAVLAPLAEIERIVAETDGYVVVANINSTGQAVIGGATDAVERAVAAFQAAGMNASRIPVSHAFHTEIVAPVSEPLRAVLRRLNVRPSSLPIVSNVTGDFYPEDADADTMLDLLGRQVASPVRFIDGLHALHAAGARVFVEVGPKKALHGFVEDVLGDDVLALFTNHPKIGDVASFNQALCGLYAAGLGYAERTPVAAAPAPTASTETAMTDAQYAELGRHLVDVVQHGLHAETDRAVTVRPPAPAAEPVVVTGAALGLPGVERVFDDENIARILDGQQFIDTIPHRLRREMLDRHITRLVKRASGDPSFEAIDNEAEVIKLAGRSAPLDVVSEFGVDTARDAALDSTTRLAIGAGFDALRDAGIPLVMHYKTTTLGTKLPDRWGLPESMRDDTGVIFASAFPGLDNFAHDLERYYIDRANREQLSALEAVRSRMSDDEPAAAEVDRRIHELRHTLETDPYVFDRRFLFRCLSMGHSQFAEIIGARGPNTQVNAACASTTQAVAVAEDWIRTGRCRRVVVVSADDASSDALLPWLGSGFLASGAAATDDIVEEAATPFDQRRHGMILGMGAAALVVESAEAASERGLQPICEVLGTVIANSAFHGTRLDVEHIGDVMDKLLGQAEARGVDRHAIAGSTVFVSHETYTPARGGSASAEIHALRQVFGPDADAVVITNTKGFTGHAMGAGVEDVVAIKSLETGLVPPVPNYKVPDPELGHLNLSTGGSYPVRYALRLGAGFGSQVAMTLTRWTPVPDGRHRLPDELGYEYRIVDQAAWRRWLAQAAGTADPALEVVQHRLRIVDTGPPATVAPSPAPAQAPTVQPAAAAVTTAAEVPAEAPADVAAAPGAGDDVTAAVVGIVSELTGYPPDLLDVDLDLEADLGVDTVKQAEVFAAIREHYGVARDDSRKVRDFPTLAHVIGWIRDKTGAPAPAAAAAAPPTAEAPAEAPAAVAAAPGAGDDVTAAVVGIVSELTGYPPDLLDLDLDLEADLGVDTVKQAEVFAAIREHYGVARDDSRKLRDFPTLTHVIGWIRDKTGAPAPAAAAAAPPTAEAPAEAPAAVAAAAGAGDDVTAAVVGIVSGLTGYPPDLLDLDLDLEADLGVDTVKQAEVFAAIREHYGVARDDSRKLRDFPTLTHVIGWIRDKTGAPAPTAAAAAPPTAEAPAEAPVEVAAAAGAGDDVTDTVVGIVSELTGYPPDLLDLDLDLEADLGVDTVKQAEVFAAIREHYGVARDDSRKLRDFPTLTHVIGWIRDKTGAPAPTAAAEAPPAAEVPAEAPVEVAAAAGAGDDVTDTVVGIVSELTGYPPDLLDVDLDLEADLGVDTVKQAEVFAAIREHYGVVRDDSLKLRDFPTLTHVIGWIRDRIEATTGPKARVDTAAAAPDAVAVTPTVKGDIAATDRIPRRVPVPMLRPPLTACVPTGVTLGAGTRVAVMPDEGGIADALITRLTRLGVDTVLLGPDDDIDTVLADGSVDGVYWLPALDDEGRLEDMDLAGWREALRRRVRNLYLTMRRLYERSPFLVVATRLGGYHGYDAAGATCPLGGAVTGFAKAYRRERPDALVKAVDFPVSRKTSALADVLVDETLLDPGCVEVGHAAGRRWGVGLADRPFPSADEAGEFLGPDPVFVVTGAAGGIVSAITADLAATWRGTFHLLDLTPEPNPADPDLRRYVDDRDGFKTEIAARLRQRGERPTPVLIERELARFERLQAALAAVRAVEDAGGTAHYHSVDLTDADAVEKVLAQIRDISGRVDVLLHAAGIEVSHALPDKEPREFDLVLAVKGDGLFNVLHAVGTMPLGTVVAFSSVAGRFGNVGQTDYSAANDLPCKLLSSFRRTRPDVRALAIDWTAWGSIGMATRGSIPKIMAAAGVDMLPAEAGVAWIRRELSTGVPDGEVVVAGALGAMAGEFHDTGGIDPASLPVDGPMLGEVARASVHDGLVVRTTLDPAARPFLDHHRIDGTPVLPGVMGMEAFAEAARILAPDWHVVALENVDFRALLKFYRDEPRTLTITALVRPDGDDLVAECRLSGERKVPGAEQPQQTVHFTGSVRLTAEPPVVDDDGAAASGDGTPALTPDQVYRLYFHGPAYQVVSAAWKQGDGAAARFASDLVAQVDGPVLTGPRLVELCFQTVGLLEAGTDGVLALPLHVGAARLNGRPEERAALVAIVRRDGHGGFDCIVRDDDGSLVLRLDGYRTVPLPDPPPEHVVAPIRDVMSG